MDREKKSTPVLSSGVIVVRRSGDRWLFLLLRAFGYWDFPKGIVEPGEDPIHTALREVEEETGITDLKFKWGEDYIESAPYLKGKKRARYYLAETETEDVVFGVNPQLGHPEHDAYKWVDSEQALALVAQRVRPCVKWALSRLESQPQGVQDRDAPQ